MECLAAKDLHFNIQNYGEATNKITKTPEAKIHITSNDESYIANKDANNSDANEDAEVSTSERSDHKQNSTTIK